jgi:hypothetical protein
MGIIIKKSKIKQRLVSPGGGRLEDARGSGRIAELKTFAKIGAASRKSGTW